MSRKIYNSARVVRTLSVYASFADAQKAETTSWHNMKPIQRIRALELMRQLNHPKYDPDTARLPRFYTVTQPKAC